MTGSEEVPRSQASRRQAYMAALRAAYALAGRGPAGPLRSYDVEADPATVERYRSLLIAAVVVDVVSAHEALTIRQELRSEGHDLG